MSHHGHHHHHHHQDHHQHHPAYQPTAYLPAGPYGGAVPPPFGPPTPYGHGYQPVPYGAGYAANDYGQEQLLDHARREQQHHRRNEHMGEMYAAAAGAFALHEAHEAEVDPAHAGRHRMEAEIAAVAAVGAAGYAMHEHMEMKKNEHLVESLGGGSGHHHHNKHHHGHEKKHHHHMW